MHFARAEKFDERFKDFHARAHEMAFVTQPFSVEAEDAPTGCFLSGAQLRSCAVKSHSRAFATFQI